MVRFTFYRTVRNVSDMYREFLDREIGPSLDDMLRNSLWRVRGYNNPLVQQGEEVAGKRMISINLEYPEPLGREEFRLLTIEKHKVLVR